jgi:hypothetical protein
LLRLAPVAAALLLVLAFVASCGGDPHDQRFRNYYPTPMETGTLIGVTPTPPR